ncbi:hypothetical protein [Methylobacterium sp. P5_C11]
MPSQPLTMPQTLTATPCTLETTVLLGRIKAMAAWDAGTALVRAQALNIRQPVINLPLAA